MAQQTGHNPITGSLDGLSYYRHRRYGYVVRKKGGYAVVDQKTSDSAEKARLNGADFGRASKAASLIRKAITSHGVDLIDPETGRFNAIMRRLVQSDTRNPLGQKNAMDGNISLLRDFNFNSRTNLGNNFKARFKTSMDRATGIMSVAVGAIDPGIELKKSPRHTHFRLRIIGIEADFAAGTSVSDMAESDLLSLRRMPLDSDEHSPFSLTVQLPARSTKPLLLVMALQYYRVRGANTDPSLDSAYNALAIIDTNPN